MWVYHCAWHELSAILAGNSDGSGLKILVEERKKMREELSLLEPPDVIIDDAPQTRPLVMISFGVAREFKGESSLNLIKLERPITTGSKAIDGITVRIFNYSEGFAPPGKTVVQVMFETDFYWWNKLQKDRPGYDAEKKRVADQVLQQLEARYPGISSQVEMIDVATPYTWWRYTHNHKGAY